MLIRLIAWFSSVFGGRPGWGHTHGAPPQTKNSASYFQGKAENASLQRVYGIAFPTNDLMPKGEGVSCVQPHHWSVTVTVTEGSESVGCHS